ncbi:MAG: hypothetical protein LKE30_06575 [Bacteroidales bacterium]|jgi:hypothetical protein|nr:hypothetical protein [Bacteroidales bacterium]
MKIINILLAVMFCLALYACSNTTDCVCTYNDGQQQTTVSDWNKSCSDITTDDVANLDEGSCHQD